MPGLYFANRAAPSGRAGLALPYTPTSGPIDFAIDHLGLKKVGQDEPISFDAGEFAGVCTDSAGECSVMVVAEWQGPGWGGIYFNHVGGSNWDMHTRQFNRFMRQVVKQRCFSAVMANRRFNAHQLADPMLSAGLPAVYMSVYISGTDTCDFAFAVHGGYFGETRGVGGQRQASDAYGYLGQIGQVDIWP